MEDHIDVILELYNEWFSNKKWWFNKNKENDIILANKYFKYVKNIKINENGTTKYLIGLIILLDQIPRHYNRVCDDNDRSDVDYYTRLACNISDKFVMNDTNDILPYEWCFILLPYRHIYNSDKITEIINFIICKLKSDEISLEDKNVYKIFLYNTCNKIYKYNTKNQLDTNIINTDIDDNFDNILDYIPTSDRLDFTINSQIDTVFKKEVRDITGENIIVSLSGGVDSCLALYLLVKYLPNNNIVAVHINYNNRSECDLEEKYIDFFCNKMGVKLWTRKIVEISRNDCHLNGLRDIYETLTKNIRFDTYYQVINKINNNGHRTLVVLGHNKDDCFENIITNISSKKNYENLCGMHINSVIENINIWRPLLTIPKKDIIEYAMNSNIGFFKDSTPKWSMRGKIRDIIRPSLENINPSITTSFFTLSTYIENNNKLVDTYIIPNLLKKFKDDLSAEFEINELIEDINIWIKLFKTKIFDNNYSLSHKSIYEYVEFIKRFKCKFADFRVNKKHTFVLKKNISAIFYKTNSETVSVSFLHS